MDGFVSLVGAGPGDPELLTLKALRRLQTADVVVYDALVNDALLGYCRADAELIYVGKRASRHTMPQAQINALLIERALCGRQVVRLKGGDPFIFGRGGEEAEALVAAGVAWEVVPGISSAVAAPAYAGIPLTHRALSSSCLIMSGHAASDTDRPINWQLAQSADTLVILMGVEQIATIAAQLIACGRRPDTPVALVRWGSTSRQETLAGTLATIAAQVVAAGFQAPAVIVVGEVVGLAPALQWFDPAASERLEPAGSLLLRQALDV